MNAFVEAALAVELPLSKCYFFQTPLSTFLFVLSSYLQAPFYKVSSYSITTWDWGEHEKGRAQVWSGF
jgi:hypothetical protein